MTSGMVITLLVFVRIRDDPQPSSKSHCRMSLYVSFFQLDMSAVQRPNVGGLAMPFYYFSFIFNITASLRYGPAPT